MRPMHFLGLESALDLWKYRLPLNGWVMSAVHLARVPEIIQGAGSVDALGSTLAGCLPRGSAVVLLVDPDCAPAA